MLVGIKPTVGRVSRYGIIPITADQDTAGPMARTVADAATLLGVLEGRAPDRHDPAPRACARVPNGDYTRFLESEGARRCASWAGSFRFRGRSASRTRWSSEAIALLRQHGAIVIDPVDIPPAPPVCRDQAGARGKDTDCSIVFKYGMKRDFNRWLVSLGPGSPVKTLTELRAVEPCAPHRRRNQIRSGSARYLRRGRSRARPCSLSRGPGGRRSADGRRRHRCRDEAPPARCDRLRRIDRRGSGGQAGVSDRDCAVRSRAEHRIAAVSTRVRRETGAAWHQLHWWRVQ